MQWLFNLAYEFFDFLFGIVGEIEAPAFIDDLTISISKYCVIANYYFPLDTAVSVALVVMGYTVILMIVSATPKISALVLHRISL